MANLSLLAVVALAGCAAASSEPAPYDAHVQRLRARLAKRGLGKLAIVVEDPFVVAGDGSAMELRRGAETVRWAVRLLERDFFAARPAAILDSPATPRRRRVLSGVSRRPRQGSDRLRHALARARRARHGRLPAPLGALRRGARRASVGRRRVSSQIRIRSPSQDPPACSARAPASRA